VGKTFLIREVYKKHKVFEMTGLKNASRDMQLINFSIQMDTFFHHKNEIDKPDNWLIAFHQLSEAIRMCKQKLKPVVFFDEIPWIAGKKSGFTEALAHWWNNWASEQNIIVVICGSAASWMIDHIVNAKGGLHNRITKLITLIPFTLAETKQFFQKKDIQLSDYQIIQIYLSVGGIPHYLEQIEKGKSAVQNIQKLCFEKDGVLRNEFENLYPALFDNAGKHIKIIKALSNKSKGLDRQEILKDTRIKDGGFFSKILTELETSGFISKTQPLDTKKKERLYRLTDEYSLFYLQFMEDERSGSWERISQTQKYKIWCGYAFENLCVKHLAEIKEALGISGIQSNANSFLHKKNDSYGKGFQIDLLIDRKDDVINICEMKFYADEFKITSEYAGKMRTKREGLKAVARTKKMVNISFITSYGVMENQHKLDLVDHDFKMDIFFKK